MEKRGKYIGKFLCIKEYKPFQKTDIGSMAEGCVYNLYNEPVPKSNEDSGFLTSYLTIQVFSEDDKRWIFTTADVDIIKKHLIEISENRINKINSIIED